MYETAFDFQLTMMLVQENLTFDQAEGIDGEIVALLIRERVESDISILNAINSNREGIWKLPSTWSSFGVRSYLDPDYESVIDIEYGEGKTLDAATIFDARIVLQIEGTIVIEAENTTEDESRVQESVLNDLFEAIENYGDPDIIKLFRAGQLVSFEVDDEDFIEDDFS